MLSAGDQLEKHASGQNVSLSSATMAIAVDGLVATVTAGSLKNMKLSYVDTAASKLAPRIA